MIIQNLTFKVGKDEKLGFMYMVTDDDQTFRISPVCKKGLKLGSQYYAQSIDVMMNEKVIEIYNPKEIKAAI
jgi:hypothetical protein